MSTDDVSAPNPLESFDETSGGTLVSTGNSEGGDLSRAYDSGMLDELQAAFEANIADGELQFSRMSIAQPLTPQVANNEPGWQSGMLFDNITEEVYTVKDYPPWLLAKGANPDDLTKLHFCMFVFITKLPNEYVKWIPRDDGGGIEWKTLDREDPRVKAGVFKRDGGIWGTLDDHYEHGKNGRKLIPPPVTVNTNFLGMAVDHEEGLVKSTPMVTSFNRTSSKAGSKLANFLSRHRMQMIPIFGRCYWLFTKSLPHAETNGSYNVYQSAVGPLTKTVNADIEGFCLEYAKKTSDKTVVDGKEKGRAFQEMILNAAQLQEDDMDSGEAVSTGNSEGGDLDSEPDF